MKKPRKIDDERLLELAGQNFSQKEIAAEFGCSQFAVSKRLKRLTPPPPSKLDDLTPQQAAFSQRVAAGMSPTAAAFETYDCTTRDSAKQIGKKLMAIDDVRGSIEELMTDCGLTRGYRIRKLKQHIDNVDPGLSLKALDLSFKVAGDMVERVEHTVDIESARLWIRSVQLPTIEIEAKTIS